MRARAFLSSHRNPRLNNKQQRIQVKHGHVTYFAKPHPLQALILCVRFVSHAQDFYPGKTDQTDYRHPTEHLEIL